MQKMLTLFAGLSPFQSSMNSGRIGASNEEHHFALLGTKQFFSPQNSVTFPNMDNCKEKNWRSALEKEASGNFSSSQSRCEPKFFIF